MTRRPSNAHALAMQAARAASTLDDEEPALAAEAAAEPSKASVEAVHAPLVADAPRGRGRPPGKRSDPEFRPTTLFLRTKTKRTAARLLEDRGDERDLSELVEDLLDEWGRRNI